MSTVFVFFYFKFLFCSGFAQGDKEKHNKCKSSFFLFGFKIKRENKTNIPSVMKHKLHSVYKYRRGRDYFRRDVKIDPCSY